MRFNGPEVQEFLEAARASITHLDCAKCRQRKLVEDFDKSYGTPTGRQLRCKECRRQIQNDHYAQPSKRIAFLVKLALQRAVNMGLPFDRNLRETLGHAPFLNCACCGKALDYRTGRGQGGRNASPSLDRLVPLRGYVEGNVKVVCLRCNRVKNNATVEDLEKILAYIQKHTTG